MSAHPYGKDVLPPRTPFGYLPLKRYRFIRQPDPITHSAYTSWEAPDPSFWVPRGYAVVNVDLRGFGTSEGVGALFSDQEAADYADVIEWAAREPWSNGRVGLNGVSYLAISQWKVAALRPAAPRRDLPLGRVERRLPRRRLSGRRARGRLHRLLGEHDGACRPGLRVVARRSAGPPAVGRFLGRPHAGARAHRGARPHLRQLLGPEPAHPRQLRGVPPNPIGPSLPLHAPGRQVVDLLLARRAGVAGAVLRLLSQGRRQRHARRAPVRLEIRSRAHEVYAVRDERHGRRPAYAGQRCTWRPASFGRRRSTRRPPSASRSPTARRGSSFALPRTWSSWAR